MYTLYSLKPRSIQSSIQIFLQKAGEGVGGIKDGNAESIDSGRRNAIKAGLAGLLVVATATTAVNTLAGEVDKGAGQAVETPFGKLSFAQIQKHPERDKILDGMKRSEKANFRDWEEQVAIEDGNRAAERRLVADKDFVKSSQELEKTVRATLDAKLKIPAKYRPTLENIISFGKPPETVKYFQEVLKNPNNSV